MSKNRNDHRQEIPASPSFHLFQRRSQFSMNTVVYLIGGGGSGKTHTAEMYAGQGVPAVTTDSDHHFAKKMMLAGIPRFVVDDPRQDKEGFSALASDMGYRVEFQWV